jgi:hypothetical protein
MTSCNPSSKTIISVSHMASFHVVTHHAHASLRGCSKPRL